MFSMSTIVQLKGTWHEIFELCFFSSNNFYWVSDTQVKWLWIRKDNRQSFFFEYLREYFDTLCLLAQRCQWHRFDFGLHIREALATFIGNIYRKNIHRQIVLHYTYNFHKQKIWGLARDRFLLQGCHWHCCDENRRFHCRFSSRIRSQIQKGVNPCIRALEGVDLWKKPEAKNLVSGSL
jgi:hypothetical protein